MLNATNTLLTVSFEINSNIYVAQSTGVEEYTDCTSAEGKTSLLNECPGYDTKQSDDEVPVMLELWGMPSTPPLSLLLGSLRPGMVAPDRALSMG